MQKHNHMNYTKFIIAINFLSYLYRVKSRCLEVLFRHPRVGPCTAEERKKRQELETSMMGCRFSAAIGWIIGLGKDLAEGHAQTKIDGIMDDLQKMPAFQDEQRLCQGWSILLYFTFQVHVKT